MRIFPSCLADKNSAFSLPWHCCTTRSWSFWTNWPRELMPATVEKISAFLPLTYVVNLLRGLWMGESWGNHLMDVGILVLMLVAGLLISVKLFRWE